MANCSVASNPAHDTTSIFFVNGKHQDTMLLVAEWRLKALSRSPGARSHPRQELDITDFSLFMSRCLACVFFPDRRPTAPAALTPSIPTPAAPSRRRRLVPVPVNTSTDSGRSNNRAINTNTASSTRASVAGDMGHLKAATTRPGQVLLAVARSYQQTSLGVGPTTTQVPDKEVVPGMPEEQILGGPGVAAPSAAEHPVAKARLIDAGLGRGRTAAAAAVVKATVVVEAVVEVEVVAAVAANEVGAGKVGGGVTPTTFRRTRSQTSRWSSRSAGCAGGGSPRRRWRSTRGPVTRCSRLSAR